MDGARNCQHRIETQPSEELGSFQPAFSPRLSVRSLPVDASRAQGCSLIFRLAGRLTPAPATSLLSLARVQAQILTVLFAAEQQRRRLKSSQSFLAPNSNAGILTDLFGAEQQRRRLGSSRSFLAQNSNAAGSDPHGPFWRRTATPQARILTVLFEIGRAHV